MYLVTKTNINPKHELYDYCVAMTALSKNIYNAALFRVRNIFTGFNKDSLSDLEQEVFDERFGSFGYRCWYQQLC